MENQITSEILVRRGEKLNGIFIDVCNFEIKRMEGGIVIFRFSFLPNPISLSFFVIPCLIKLQLFVAFCRFSARCYHLINLRFAS